jgi:hypothetical protein
MVVKDRADTFATGCAGETFGTAKNIIVNLLDYPVKLMGRMLFDGS